MSKANLIGYEGDEQFVDRNRNEKIFRMVGASKVPVGGSLGQWPAASSCRALEEAEGPQKGRRTVGVTQTPPTPCRCNVAMEGVAARVGQEEGDCEEGCRPWGHDVMAEEEASERSWFTQHPS